MGTCDEGDIISADVRQVKRGKRNPGLSLKKRRGILIDILIDIER